MYNLYYIKNGDLKPSDVTKGSNKRVWWECPKGNDHEWKAIVSLRCDIKIEKQDEKIYLV